MEAAVKKSYGEETNIIRHPPKFMSKNRRQNQPFRYTCEHCQIVLLSREEMVAHFKGLND